MFATRTRLLIGMPKCGCIYATRVLAAAFGKNKLSAGTQHAPLCTIPEQEYSNLTIVGMIRNPFAWYYSRWAYFYYNAPEAERYEFPEYFSRHFLNPFGPVGKKVESFPPCEIQVGAFTYMHLAYHCRNAKQWLGSIDSQSVLAERYNQTLATDHLMRTEQLTDDMLAIFGPSIQGSLDQPRNAISHGPYQDGYSPSMRRQVEDADGWFLERYNYSME